MSDLISRQSAIKAIEDLPNCENGYSDTYDKAYIIGVLEELPSTEPEIIRCKDCIWHLKDDSCARLYCITDDDFYCWHGRREE